MIKVNVLIKDNLIKEIRIKGHADYETYGKDIVCASVSTLATTTINDILAIDDKAIKFDAKEGNITIINNDSELADKLLNVLLNSLKELASDYPKNIKIGG